MMLFIDGVLVGALVTLCAVHCVNQWLDRVVHDALKDRTP
jgi:hypothetical protein